MIHKTKIGVCVDDGVAYLLEEKNDEKVITIIDADEETTNDNIEEIEDTTIIQTPYMKKKQAFYYRVFEIIKNFDNISLFGTASAKRELMTRIRAHKLNHIEIENNPLEEKITENHKIEFINQYFSSCS
jgi:hypothetical protein